jgi:hypothetical protein
MRQRASHPHGSRRRRDRILTGDRQSRERDRPGSADRAHRDSRPYARLMSAGCPEWTAEEVLDRGLPTLPSTELPVGAEAPVAVRKQAGVGERPGGPLFLTAKPSGA